MAVEQTVVTGTYSLYLLTSLPTFTAYTICGWFKWVSAPNSYQAPFGLVTATSDYHTPYCYNCNCARGARGYCPHELVLDEQIERVAV